jgi:hypothetical protein
MVQVFLAKCLVYHQKLEAYWKLVSVVRKHLNKVKQAVSSPSNMDKTLKEEAVHTVNEMDSLLNKLEGVFCDLECTLGKALRTAEKEKARRYSELLATSSNTQKYSLNKPHPVAQPSDSPPSTAGLIVTAADPNTSSHKAKRLIKEAIDPKALKLGVSKLKKPSKQRCASGM